MNVFCHICGKTINAEIQRTTTIMDHGTMFIAHESCAPRVKNRACNEIDHPNTLKENIMAENNNQDPTVVTPDGAVVETPSKLLVWATKHPRALKTLAIIGVVGTGTGVVLTARTISSNKSHVHAAGDHAKAALTELSSSVDPASTEN